MKRYFVLAVAGASLMATPQAQAATIIELDGWGSGAVVLIGTSGGTYAYYNFKVTATLTDADAANILTPDGFNFNFAFSGPYVNSFGLGQVNWLYGTPQPVPPPEGLLPGSGYGFAAGWTSYGNARITYTDDVVTQSSLVSQLLGSAVPEPATWAMMIAGFGLAGGALRRRASAVAVT